MIKTIKLKPIMSVEESDKKEGALLKQSDCKILITQDTDVYDEETGKCIAKFRKNVIPGSVQVAAYNSLLPAAKPTNNRGNATKKEEGGNASKNRINKNGTMSKTTIADGGAVNSGIVGYFDRNVRFPNCRLTAFNKKHFDKFKKAYPLIKLVDNFYKTLMPKEYKAQRSEADKTSQDFVIKDTAFTTVTVNKNWQTAVHKDAGDFKGGFGNLVAIRDGDYSGCHFVVVRWGVGFDLRNGDLLLVDVHQWHGNTPMIKEQNNATRLSLVMYYRENMIHCDTMEKELQRVKNRKRGDTIN
jgi:hypothetical protein